ncbi:uncharacterized protein [Mobula birostris]|uniref:uncharacterized protein n=1 Tax=Mobula birostris TaxID=1983395 RepID=UPI003B28D5EE
MDSFSRACQDFSLTISLKKTNVLGQGVEHPLAITINNYELEVVHEFTYLVSTITDSLSLDPEINRRIGRAASTFARLTKRVWENRKLTTHTKVAVYRACVFSTLLYGSETWRLYSRQERRLNAFHLRSLRRILDITWTDRVTNNEVLARAQIPSLFTLLQQRRLRWLGHVHCMSDGRIQKDLLYGELASGKRAQGQPHLRFKDVCKRDRKSLKTNVERWEDIASDRSHWRLELRRGLKRGEEKLRLAAEEKRTRRESSTKTTLEDSAFKCSR